MAKRQGGGRKSAPAPVLRRCVYCMTPTPAPKSPKYVPATEQTVEVIEGETLVLWAQSRLTHHPRIVPDVLPLCELVRRGLERKGWG